MKDIRGITLSEAPIRRILYVNPTSEITGAEVALLELMENLPRQKYEPFLVCPLDGPLAEAAKNKGIPVYFLPTGASQARAWDTLRLTIPNAIGIARLAKTLKIDLIHANTPRAGYAAGLAGRMLGKPSILHVRDYRNSPFRTRLRRWLFRLASDRIIVVSEAARSAVCSSESSLCRKFRVIPDGLPPVEEISTEEKRSARAALGIAAGSLAAAQIGWYEQLKGQKTAVEAWRQVTSRYPDALLLLVGKALDAAGEQYGSELQQLIDNCGLQDRVRLTGFCPDIRTILAAVDIVIHPAVLPDALPHVLLEAGAYRLPAVGSRIGGIPEIIEDEITGLLVEPGDASVLAQGIIRLLGSPAEREQMGRAAREQIRHKFSIDRHVGLVTDLYDLLIRKAR